VLGRSDTAVDVLHEAMTDVDQPAIAGRYRAMLSAALCDAGRITEAAELLRSLPEGDRPEDRARRHWAWGRLFTFTSQLDRAKTEYSAALEAYDQIEDTLTPQRLRIRLAEIENLQGHPGAARQLVRAAKPELEYAGDAQDRALALIEEAMAIASFDNPRARRLAREAVTVGGPDDRSVAGKAAWLDARVFRLTGDYRLAAESMLDAYRLLRPEHRLIAEILDELATIAELDKRNPTAPSLLEALRQSGEARARFPADEIRLPLLPASLRAVQQLR